jgi:hypothetical protein
LKIKSVMHLPNVEEAMAKASPSGRTKEGVMVRFESTPIPAFPHRGERRRMEQDLPLPFSFSVGERKLMSHFLVQWHNRVRLVPQAVNSSDGVREQTLSETACETCH